MKIRQLMQIDVKFIVYTVTITMTTLVKTRRFIVSDGFDILENTWTFLNKLFSF